MSYNQQHRVVPIFAVADTAPRLPMRPRFRSQSRSPVKSTTMEPIRNRSPLSTPPTSAEMAPSASSDGADPHSSVSMDEDSEMGEMGELWADRIYPALMGKNNRLISTGSLIMDLIDCHGHTAVVSKRIQDNALEHPQVSQQQRERMEMIVKAQRSVRDSLLELIKEFGNDKVCTEEYNRQVLREASQGQLASEDAGQVLSQDMFNVDDDDAMQD